MLPRGKFSCVGLLLLGECHGLLLSHRGADRKTRFSPAPNVDKHEQTEVALGWFETEVDVLALSGLDLEGVDLGTPTRSPMLCDASYSTRPCGSVVRPASASTSGSGAVVFAVSLNISFRICVDVNGASFSSMSSSASIGSTTTSTGSSNVSSISLDVRVRCNRTMAACGLSMSEPGSLPSSLYTSRPSGVATGPPIISTRTGVGTSFSKS